MNNKNNQLILTLLKAELKNTKLLHGLQSIGLTADDYYLGISTELLRLFGFPDPDNDDELHDFYFKELELRCNHKLDEFFGNLSNLAKELYEVMEKERVKKEEGAHKKRAR